MLDVCFFRYMNAISTLSTLNDVVQYAQRTMAECTQFVCAGRAEFPEFLQIFRPIFAQSLRDLGAGLALHLALERAPTQKRGAANFFGLRNNAGRVHAIFLRAARRKIAGNLQFFRASWAQNLRDLDAGRLLFSDLNAILTCLTLSDIVV